MCDRLIHENSMKLAIPVARWEENHDSLLIQQPSGNL
jgi:hypothetical protein